MLFLFLDKTRVFDLFISLLAFITSMVTKHTHSSTVVDPAAAVSGLLKGVSHFVRGVEVWGQENLPTTALSAPGPGSRNFC